MIKQFIFFAMVAFYFLQTFFTPEAFSARRARVIQNDVPVFSSPDQNAEELGVVDNMRVITSNQPTNGFYKVRLPDQTLGWIEESDLEFEGPEESNTKVEDSRNEIKQSSPFSRLEKKKKDRFKVKALGGYVFFNSKEINEHLGLNVLKNGRNFSLSTAYLFTRKFSVTFRGEWISHSMIGRDLGKEKVYDFNVVSFPLFVGFDILLSENRRFWSEISAMGGIALNTQFTATSMYDVEPNKTSIRSSPLAFKGLFSVGLKPVLSWQWFSVFLEAGYLYLKTSNLRPYRAGFGYEVFALNNDFAELPIQLSGPIAAGGLVFRF